jgi:hypothetical protein
VLKSLLLATLVVLAILAASYGLTLGVANAHGLLFVAACVVFVTGDRALWSRT